jgi:hypothetical protein
LHPRHGAAALACLAFLTLPHPSSAEIRRKILLLVEKTRPAFLPRLLAELGSAGFDVAFATPSTFPPDRSEIEQLADREGAGAELLLLEGGAGVEIWVVDPSTDRATFREVVLGLYEPREAPEVIAIRLVETLRAALIEFASPRTSTPHPVFRAPPDVAARMRAEPARYTLAIGGGGAYSTGGVGATGHLDLALRFAIVPRLSVAVDGAFTPVRAKLRGPEGDANFAWYLTGVSLSFCASDPAAPVRFRSGVGAWLGWLNLTGQAAAPYVNTRADIVSVIPHLDAGLSFSLTRAVALSAGVSMGISAPAASIRFADREVATWGRPLWIGGLVLESALAY